LAASYTIREATAADIDCLVAFTLQEAREAEGYEANEAAVRCGVEGGFGERRLGPARRPHPQVRPRPPRLLLGTHGDAGEATGGGDRRAQPRRCRRGTCSAIAIGPGGQGSTTDRRHARLDPLLVCEPPLRSPHTKPRSSAKTTGASFLPPPWVPRISADAPSARMMTTQSPSAVRNPHFLTAVHIDRFGEPDVAEGAGHYNELARWE
jgi:hypothetical protein